MAFGSDRADELVERGRDTELFGECVDTEFVVTAAQVLHERMTAEGLLRWQSGVRSGEADG